MEKQINQFLIEILENCHSNIDNDFLDKYYELFNTKKYFGKDFDSIYNDMEQIYKIQYNYIPFDKSSSEIYKKLVLSVINTSDNKKRFKLIPLIVYLDVENILYSYLYENNYFDSFLENKDYFIGELKSFNIDINIPKNISIYNWENEYYKNYQEGLEEKDFNKIYNFIESVQERNFMYEPLVNFLSFVSVKIFFDDFVTIFENTKNVFKINYLLSKLTIKEKLSLADKTKNDLVKFDAIRSCVYFQNNNFAYLNILKDENKLLENIIFSLSQEEEIWKNVLNYFLIFPLRNPQLFLPLANILSKCSKGKIDIFIDTININQYFDENSKKALRNSVLTIENIEVQKYIVEKIFDRWNNFIDNYDDYMGKLFLTDVIDIIIFYVVDFLPEKIILEEINRIIFNMKEIDNKWFNDISEQQNYLYKQLSKLFVYGFGIDKYRLDEEKNKLESLLKNLEYDLKNDESTLEEFNRYIIKK